MPHRPPDIRPPRERMANKTAADNPSWLQQFQKKLGQPPPDVLSMTGPLPDGRGATAVPVPTRGPHEISSDEFYFPGRKLITDAQYCSHMNTAFGAYPNLNLISSGGIVWQTNRYILGVYRN